MRVWHVVVARRPSPYLRICFPTGLRDVEEATLQNVASAVGGNLWEGKRQLVE